MCFGQSIIWSFYKLAAGKRVLAYRTGIKQILKFIYSFNQLIWMVNLLWIDEFVVDLDPNWIRRYRI